MKIDFSRYSPQELRDQTEIEFQKCGDAKQAVYNALAFLNNMYGVLEKAKNHKYIRRTPDGKGGWKYFYNEENKKEKKIQVKSVSEIKEIFDFFKIIGFSPLFGTQEINRKAIKKSIEVAEKIKNIKTNEMGYSIDNNGLIVFNKKGDKYNIEISPSDAEKIRNTEIFIHNHTENKTLSCNDIMIAACLGIKNFSAVYEDKKYSIQISLKNNLQNEKNIKENMFTLAKGLASSFIEAKKDLSEKINNNEMTLKKANSIESKLIIKKILSNKDINNLFLITYIEE